MAQASKPAPVPAAAATPGVPMVSQGAGGILISDAHLGGNRQANRKKMKQRQKLAAKQAAEFQRAMKARDREMARSGRDSYGEDIPEPATQPAPQHHHQHHHHQHPHQHHQHLLHHQQPPPPLPAPQEYDDAASDGQELYDEEDDYTEDEGQAYDRQRYDGAYPNGHASSAAAAAAGSRKKPKKKKKNKPAAADPYNGAHVPSHAAANALRHAHHGQGRGSIWNTSTHEERERIKEFWLGLEEDKRKSLVKIEKEAVLKKMKEQQKHSCSCTVCGRKRTAIEEELEVLYDAYYDELEGYVIRNPEEFFRDDEYAHRPLVLQRAVPTCLFLTC